MRVIDQIANLILEDPFITATAIARRLGYAEEKTVYYWLHKSHYSGLTAFKKAVLQGQYRPPETHALEAPSARDRLPIVSRWTDDGQPVFDGETLVLPLGGPAELIWRYNGPPLLAIMPQDLLVLTRVDPHLKSPWLVVRRDQTVELRLAVTYGTHLIPVHPLTLERDNKCTPLYQILQLIRHY
ncbi:MAG: hypothetical protein OWU33_06750 [Firmicutes bacterium]|nr:hypothetical protein [Bacillota bacterium]